MATVGGGKTTGVPKVKRNTPKVRSQVSALAGKTKGTPKKIGC